MDQAIALLSNGRRPVFLFLHLFDPHWPYAPPDKYRIFSERRSENEPIIQNTDFVHEAASLLPKDTRKQTLINLYDGEILFTDAQLGRLFHYLKQSGLWENSIVVVTSDHGEEFLDHGFWGHGHSVYQEQVHVPLFFHCPKSLGLSPKTIANPVGLIDILPTLCDLLGIRRDLPVQGSSFTCLLTGMCLDSWMQEYFYYQDNGSYGYRVERYKYLDKAVTEKGGYERSDPARLFDLVDDPYEVINLFSTQKPLAMELHKRMAARAKRDGEAPFLHFTDTELLQQRLKSLGYLQ